MPAKKLGWDDNFKKIRDIVFIIMFLATCVGWLATSVKSKAELKLQQEIIKGHVNQILEFQKQQLELNGKIIMYMEMDSED